MYAAQLGWSATPFIARLGLQSCHAYVGLRSIRALAGFPNDREGQKQFTMMLRAGFPDASQTIEELIAEGDKVVMRWTGRGTNRGEFMGIPATGKPVTVAGMDIYRLEGDKIVEHWGEWDMMGMMQQLGVAPTPG